MNDQTSSSSVPENRFEYLDGLRGFASVAVCLWHNFLAFFPGAVTPNVPMHSRLLENTLYRSPFAVFFAGDFSVFIFFAISGFVISIKHFRSDDLDGLKRSFLKRYVRLMPPAFVTIFLAYLLLSFGLMSNQTAGGMVHSWWLKANWSNVDVSFKHVLWSGLYGMWFQIPTPQSAFNSNLGTLAIELLGSFVIYITLIIMKNFKLSFQDRCVVYIGLVGFTALITVNDPNYVVFFTGMFLADLFVNCPRAFRISTGLSSLVLALGVFFGAMNTSNLIYFYYQPIARFLNFLNLGPLVYPWAVGALLVMYGVLTNPFMQKILSSNVARLFGKYSYALYVTHTVFLGSVTCGVFVALSNFLDCDFRVIIALTFFGTLPFLLLVTYLVQLVDAKALRVSHLF